MLAGQREELMKNTLCRMAGAVALFFSIMPPASAQEPTGLWLTAAGDARIRVARCGLGICGSIVWLKEPIDPVTSKPQVDDKNPDPALQNRRILGLRIFTMHPNGPGKWSGRIYNADDGKTYNASVMPEGPAALKVEGCVLSFCGSESWTKVGDSDTPPTRRQKRK
jgi:uncharacterized protein (DUF2147 family)